MCDVSCAPEQSLKAAQRGCLLRCFRPCVPQEIGYIFCDQPEGAWIRERRVLLEQRSAALEAVVPGLQALAAHNGHDLARVGKLSALYATWAVTLLMPAPDAQTALMSTKYLQGHLHTVMSS